jgi:hypothetical protein
VKYRNWILRYQDIVSVSYKAGGMLKIFICIVFGLEYSRYKQAYIEYESQSQGIRSQLLLKQKKDHYRSAVTKRRKTVFTVSLHLREARSNGRIFVI